MRIELHNVVGTASASCIAHCESLDVWLCQQLRLRFRIDNRRQRLVAVRAGAGVV